MKRNTHIISILFFFTMLSTNNTSWAAGFVVPDCNVLERWTLNIPVRMTLKPLPYVEQKRFNQEQKKQIDLIYSDEKTEPVFGIPYSKWTVYQGKQIHTKAMSCTKTMSKLSAKSKVRIDVATRRLKNISAGRSKLPGQEIYITRAPDCSELKSWVNVLATRKEIHSNANNYGRIKEIYNHQKNLLFADRNVISYFGQPIRVWTIDDFDRAITLTSNCWNQERRVNSLYVDKLRQAISYLEGASPRKTSPRKKIKR